MRQPNWELIDKTLMEIEHHPQHFDMSVWGYAENPDEQSQVDIPLCGTAMCFAGWVVTLSGAKIQWRSSISAEQCVTPEGEKRMVSVHAMELLNLTTPQADAIFLETDISTVGQLREKIYDVLGEPQ